jgi:hypothetical protein
MKDTIWENQAWMRERYYDGSKEIWSEVVEWVQQTSEGFL